MATVASDFGGQCLVTDLVHELSSGLEIPFLLAGTGSTFDKESKFSDLLFDNDRDSFQYSDKLYGEEDGDMLLDQNISFNPNSVNSEIESISPTDDLTSYLISDAISAADLKTDLSGNGSDSSSTEFGTILNKRDSSPTVSSGKRVSPENIILVSENELKLISISSEGCKGKTFNGYSKGVRIQPKPNIMLDSICNKQCNDQSLICNVFKGVQSAINGSQNHVNHIVGSKNNGALSRKDCEILQAKRKQERMIRNRESAYLSRKRKKEYVAHLEKQVQELVDENNRLQHENFILKERLKKYDDLESFGHVTKDRNTFKESPRKATALLMLMLTVCLNIGSFSNFINDKTADQSGGSIVQNDKVPLAMQNMRHTRSLLWTSPQLDDLKSSLANLSTTSCPINQTESIRLESELRRWIRGEEDFSRPSRRNIRKINQYFYASDRVTKNQTRSKRRNRIRKMQTSADVGMDVFRMKPHFFDFNTFFEAIHRRDDTFYLVSFSADHLLLPALAHNKTSRPKMSLMLPAFLSNGTFGVSSDQVEMMQIDCEVTNTQLLSVNENDIPSHMRPYTNSTSKQRNAAPEVGSQFSEFLMDDLTERKNFDDNMNNSVDKGFRDLPLRMLRNASNETAGRSLSKGARSNLYKLARFHGVNNHVNESVKEQPFKSTSKVGVDKRAVKESNDLSDETANNNRSENDGMPFIDGNEKNFLKTLIVPPNLQQTKHLDYTRRPFVKNFKSTIKFLIP